MDGELFIPITMFVAMAVVIWKFIDSRQKVRTIALEKGTVDENFKYLFGTLRQFGSESKPSGYVALKWGLATLLIGAALLISIPLQAFRWAQIHQGELITGLIFTAGGLGFLIYYAIVAGAEKKENK
ncbi:MAG: hypothetical protein WBQ23_13645 [Bacteroidota bacterium]